MIRLNHINTWKICVLLNGIDNNTNMINIIGIIGLDACKNIHPNSFELDGYHGGVRALD